MFRRYTGPIFLSIVGVLTLLLAGCSGSTSSQSTDSPTTTSATVVVISTTTTSIPEPATSTTTATTTTDPGPNAISAYFIGNSLTDDTLGTLSDDVRSFFMLAQLADYNLQPLAWNIECGASLISIVMLVGENCTNPVDGIGYFDEALPAHEWDFLIVQPYPSRESTLGTDIAVIQELAQMIPQDATVLVFTGWPRYPDFTETWLADETIADDSPTSFARIYFTTLVNRLDELLDQQVALLPSAEVLYRLQSRIEAGEVPGVEKLRDLYADTAHLTPMGQWLSAVTAASVITGEDPSSFGKPDEPWYGDGDGFSKEYITAVHEIVTEVLTE